VRRVWLTLYKDGQPTPEGFSTRIGELTTFDYAAKMQLLDAALESLGYEARFNSEEPTGDGANDEYINLDQFK